MTAPDLEGIKARNLPIEGLATLQAAVSVLERQGAPQRVLDFIAHAPADHDALVAEVERLAVELADLLEAGAELTNMAFCSPRMNRETCERLKAKAPALFEAARKRDFYYPPGT